MEHTPGGQVFNNWRGLNGMYPEWGTKTLLDPKNIWEALSRQYANDVSGTVTYAHSENYTGAVLNEIEYPIIQRRMDAGIVTDFKEVFTHGK